MPAGPGQSGAVDGRNDRIFHKGVRNVLVLQAIALAVLVFAVTIVLGDEPEAQATVAEITAVAADNAARTQ